MEESNNPAFKENLRRYLRLYAVTSRNWIGTRTLLEQIELALAGGATAIQLREKDLERQAFLSEAFEVKNICEHLGRPLIINDNVDVALGCDADGVHLGQGDMSLTEARKILGKDKIIGASVHSVGEAKDAERDGADYLGAGAAFPTSSKSDAINLSLDVLVEICDSVSIPVVAIGGISVDNVDKLRNTGIAGIAVVSAIFAQPDIETSANFLKRRVDQLLI